ncbi:MAG: sigma-70 family RNA polymerase sigma factor, partial [Longimicrobiales bacterium]
GRYQFVNSAAERLKGLPAEALLGNYIGDVYPEPMRTRIVTAFRRVVDEDTAVTLEEHFAPTDMWYEIHAYPSDEGVWILFRDITERKRAALREQRETEPYRALFERSPIALYRTAPDGSLIDVNAALVRLLGYPDRESFLRVNAEDVYVNPRDRRRWQNLLEKQGEVSFEMRDRRFDGSIIWVRDVARAIRGENGEVLFYEGMLEDITARKEAEAFRREDEERFRLLMHASDDVIWDWEIGTGRVTWNEALRRVFGHAPEDIGPGIEQSYAWWLSHIHPDDRSRVAAALHDAVDSGASEFGEEYRFRHLDGSYSPVLDRGYIGRDAAGRPIRLIGALTDLGKRRRSVAPARPRKPDAPPVPATADATLIGWIAQGDERGLNELYARHAPGLFALASSLATHSADEIVADTFLRAWETAATFDAERGSVTGWLSQICRSRALEQMRKRRRRSRLLERALEQPEATRPDVLRHDRTPDADGLADRLDVESSLARLPEPQRRVLELAFFAGLSHSEIADRLNQPLGTVKTRIRTGLERMKVQLRRSR